jgi:tRNA-splicing ligase RtcB (3'-phosphate/5'-hydroxy nucleic acid ligase)
MSLTGKDLKGVGFEEGKALGLALQVIEKNFSTLPAADQLSLLKQVLADPATYLQDEHFGVVANQLLQPADPIIPLQEEKAYAIYGAAGIEQGALNQMQTAMRLPVTVGGALMPDAHQGYGLPIGGVLATHNVVIPYGVGVDIGCRMCMTLYAMPPALLQQKTDTFKKMLTDNTRFGIATFKKPQDDAIFERQEFQNLSILRGLKDRAWQQIGSSGGGNHFVEFGVVEVTEAINELKVPVGQYLAVLSHSGSRGLGANIARHYTDVAMNLCKLPAEAKHLAWLGLDTEAGQEYWLAMNLAGDYASACHHQIHNRLAAALGEKPIAMIENHHNFAWREKDASGREIIVHRKGATPAGKGVLGIIPGSMASPGFIVRGKGLAASISSASHGAGRLMSRTKAKENISPTAVKAMLQREGVELIGSGLDEAPMAYKNIYQVMEYQKDLVDTLGTFMPRIVRMCGDERFQEVD